MADDIVKFDIDSGDTLEHLTRVIAWEMTARLAVGDRVDTPEGIRGLASLVADTVLDFFEVSERAGNTPPH